MNQPVIDIAHLQSWVGREQVVTDDMSPFKAQALSSALARDDYSPLLPEAGSALPPAWQWLYFVDTPSALHTDVDGHQKAGGFLPPVPLPRRMWAAGKFNMLNPLTLGVPAEKRSLVSSVELKQGSTGTLIFVNVRHTFMQNGQACIEEDQNLVYREMPTGHSPMPEGRLAPEEADWRIAINPDPVLLFRYSALTYNSHRIHYDRQYAVDEEYYPALVVHGPLQATLLANSVRQYCEGMRFVSLDFRAQRPLFDTDSFQACGKREGNTVKVWTCSHDGFIGVTGTAMIEGEQ